MLNKKMIEKFKNFENDVNYYDALQFYTFNDFIEKHKCCDEYIENDIKNEYELRCCYNCNNDNTIVLLYNVDDDEYLIINFENDNLIITQNIDIFFVNDDYCKNALYEILKFMFTNDYYD